VASSGRIGLSNGPRGCHADLRTRPTPHSSSCAWLQQHSVKAPVLAGRLVRMGPSGGLACPETRLGVDCLLMEAVPEPGHLTRHATIGVGHHPGMASAAWLKKQVGWCRLSGGCRGCLPTAVTGFRTEPGMRLDLLVTCVGPGLRALFGPIS
jgi:hypothetical protein